MHHRIGEIELNNESLPFFLMLASVGAILFFIHRSGIRRGLSTGENRIFRILWVIYGVAMVLFVVSELIITSRATQ